MKSKVKIRRIAITLISVILACTYFSACSQSTAYSFYDYLGTYSCIAVQDGYSVDLYNTLSDKIKEIDDSVSLTVTSSDIVKFNNACPGDTVEISGATYNILLSAIELYDKTAHLFNPAIGHLIDLWGFGPSENEISTDNESIPDEELINAFSGNEITDFSQVTVYESSGRYYAEKPGGEITVKGKTYSMKLNLGGIAKGYATVVTADAVKQSTDYFYSSIGSSSVYCGKNRSAVNGSWSLTLVHPRDGDSFLSAEVKDLYGSTSGDYQKYKVVDGKRYCHIINPLTGYPCDNGVITATVLGSDGTILDGLTTAVMIMGRQSGTEFLRTNYPGFKYIITEETSDGLTVHSNTEKITVECDDAEVIYDK